MSPLLRPGDKVVLATFGTHGDVIPFLAVARHLARRGLRPVLASAPFYRELVEDAGVAFCPLPPTQEQLLRDTGMDVPDLFRRSMGKLGGVRFATRKLVLPYLAQTWAALDEACSGAQLLVSHLYVFAAPLVAERRAMHWRTICLQPMALMSPYDRPVLSELLPVHRLQPLLGPERYGRTLRTLASPTRRWFAPVDALRARLGLAPAHGHPLLEGAHAPGGVFAMFDPVLMRDFRGLPPNTLLVGSAHDDGTDGRLAPDLEAFLRAGPPPVAFTLGTSAVHNPGRFYEEASQACRALGQRAVFLKGGNAFGAALPPGQLAVDSASHAGLFPHCAAVVHQGGAGTCFQAMRAGVPQLVVPHGNDQPDNAARLVELGVALRMRSWPLAARSMRPRLQRLLADAALRDAARQLAGRLLPQDGAEKVAQILVR